MSLTSLLRVEDLVVDYPGRSFRSPPFRALDGVSFQVEEGETFGLVGESGSGKTTLGRAILGLVPVASGRIIFEGEDISQAGRAQRRRLARDLQVVFQDPYSSLNPSMVIADILAEPLRAQGLTKSTAAQRVAEALETVGLPRDSLQRMAREFSGGQRQRIAIARALIVSPRLVVCDESVSALDLSTRARVLDLFLKIQQDSGVAYLFVSHDLDVIGHLSHRIAVMRAGRIVEQGPARTILGSPRHPYTRQLMLASLVPDPDLQAQRRQQRHRLASSHSC